MVYTKVFFSQSRDITTDPESQRYAESLFPQSWLSLQIDLGTLLLHFFFPKKVKGGFFLKTISMKY